MNYFNFVRVKRGSPLFWEMSGCDFQERCFSAKENLYSLASVNGGSENDCAFENLDLRDLAKRGRCRDGKSFPKYVRSRKVLLRYSEFLSAEDLADFADVDHIYYIRYYDGPVCTNKSHFRFVKGNHVLFRYEQISEIADGTSGNVIKCFDHKSKKTVAIKFMKDDVDGSCSAQKEVEIMKHLGSHGDGSIHHHIARYLRCFKFRGFFCIVMLPYKDDFHTIFRERQYIGFTNSMAKIYARQLADALSFIHSANVAHCDVKPGNLLKCDAKTIKLIDFGLSCYADKPMYKSIQSLRYRAPEVVFGLQYGTEADVWSFGCMLYEFVRGRPLFLCDNEDGLIRKYCEILGPPPISMLSHDQKMQDIIEKMVLFEKEESSLLEHIRIQIENVDDHVVDLISRCLKWDPFERISMSEALNHPYLTQ